jgi:hypothetical protein
MSQYLDILAGQWIVLVLGQPAQLCTFVPQYFHAAHVSSGFFNFVLKQAYVMALRTKNFLTDNHNRRIKKL